MPKLSTSYQNYLQAIDKNILAYVGIGLSYFQKIKKVSQNYSCQLRYL